MNKQVASRELKLMAKSTLNFLAVMTAIAIVSSVITVDAAQDKTCNACQCQVNNVQVLSQLIESKISTVLKNGTGK